jgi:hypothetical protein
MGTKERMQDYRLRLRKQGLRPVQIWVPDQRAPGFRKQLLKQIERLDQQDEANALDFIAEVVDWSET